MYKSGIEVFERVVEEDEYVKRFKDKSLEEAKEEAASFRYHFYFLNAIQYV